MTKKREQIKRPGGTYELGGIQVARVGYGVMQLPKLKEPAQAKAILRRAYELGVNHYDTADFYGNSVANGYLAEELSRESDVIFVTKIGARPSRDGRSFLEPAQRPEQLRQLIEDNLRSLKREQLEVVNFRRIAPGLYPLEPSQQVSFDDQLTELIAMREEGLIGQIGLSSVSMEEFDKALPIGIACVQNQYNILSRTHENMLEICRKEAIAWIPYFPLGGGYPGAVDVTSDPVVCEISRRMGISPAQVALAWLLQHSQNTLIIPGTTSITHLEENINVGNIKLEDEDLLKLENLYIENR